MGVNFGRRWNYRSAELLWLGILPVRELVLRITLDLSGAASLYSGGLGNSSVPPFHVSVCAARATG